MFSSATDSGDAAAVIALGSKAEWIARYEALSQQWQIAQNKAGERARKNIQPILNKVAEDVEKRAADQIVKEREVAESLGVAFTPSSGAESLLATSLAWRKKSRPPARSGCCRS